MFTACAMAGRPSIKTSCTSARFQELQKEKLVWRLDGELQPSCVRARFERYLPHFVLCLGRAQGTGSCSRSRPGEDPLRSRPLQSAEELCQETICGSVPSRFAHLLTPVQRLFGFALRLFGTGLDFFDDF